MITRQFTRRHTGPMAAGAVTPDDMGS